MPSLMNRPLHFEHCDCKRPSAGECITRKQSTRIQTWSSNCGYTLVWLQLRLSLAKCSCQALEDAPGADAAAARRPKLDLEAISKDEL